MYVSAQIRMLPFVFRRSLLWPARIRLLPRLVYTRPRTMADQAAASSSSVRTRSLTPSSPPSKKARLDGESELPAVASPQAAKKQPRQPKKRKFKRPASPEPGTSEDVILRDVMALLGAEAVQAMKEAGTDYTSPLDRGQEIELVVSELSSNGEIFRVLIEQFQT